MLRMSVAQQCFGLSDEGIEDAIYDSQAIRGFVGIDRNRKSPPDATTLLKFRRRLEQRELTRKIFETINGHLAAQGLMMREGTIGDARLIAASASTKNKDQKRDPEMHQSKKGNDWHFGLTAHIGVDSASGLLYTLIGTAGNVSVLTQAHALLHVDEVATLGDADYQSVQKREENIGKSVTWHVAMKRSKRKELPNNKLGRMAEKLERLKLSFVRAKIEHPFHVVKNRFRHRKARYRGLKKHGATVHVVRLRQSDAGWPTIAGLGNPSSVLRARNGKKCGLNSQKSSGQQHKTEIQFTEEVCVADGASRVEVID